MGMYDEFKGTCPHCGKEYYAQTKLFSCDMYDLTVGFKIDNHTTMNLQCKNECEHCNKPVVVVIKNGIVKKFADPEIEKPTHKEKLFGMCETNV